MSERTFTVSEVQELMQRLGDSILEVLDADQDQCGAWGRKGEALIAAMTTSEPEPETYCDSLMTAPSGSIHQFSECGALMPCAIHTS